MRGEDSKQEAIFSYVSPEKRVPTDHPSRPIRERVDNVLKEMSPHFARLYAQHYLSDEHFTVDGTLIEAWVRHKSFRPKEEGLGAGGGNREGNFRGEVGSKDTQQATTDPEARRYKKTKGSEAKLSYLGHGLTENPNGLLVKTRVTLAGGIAEREAALRMAGEAAFLDPAVEPVRPRIPNAARPLCAYRAIRPPP